MKQRKIGSEEVRNKYELDILKDLKSKSRKRKFIYDYESEFIPYVLTKKYQPDFIITREDGGKIYIETKGYFRPADRAKMIAVKRNHPDLDIRIIFYRNDKIKGSKSRYTDWCERHKFPCHVGHDVPTEWLA